jgi:hypothetical protein
MATFIIIFSCLYVPDYNVVILQLCDSDQSTQFSAPTNAQYFVGAAATAPTKHAGTRTFVHMLGDFSIYSRA